MTPAAARPVRRYAIHRCACYSLRDAARAADLPERRLRRAVVLGDLPAEPVADERDYLIEGRHLQDHIRSIRRGERADFTDAEALDWGIGVFLAFPLLAILMAIAGLSSAPPADIPDAQAAVEVPAPAPKPRPVHGSGPWTWYPDLRQNLGH